MRLWKRNVWADTPKHSGPRNIAATISLRDPKCFTKFPLCVPISSSPLSKRLQIEGLSAAGLPRAQTFFKPEALPPAADALRSLSVCTYEPDVRSRAAAPLARTAALVKVFGCLQAYENRPSTNPRACGSRLWGFRVLLEGDEGSAEAMTARTRTRRVRLCPGRSLDWELAACEVQVFCHGVGERHADDGRRNKGRCGAS